MARGNTDSRLGASVGDVLKTYGPKEEESMKMSTIPMRLVRLFQEEVLDFMTYPKVISFSFQGESFQLKVLETAFESLPFKYKDNPGKASCYNLKVYEILDHYPKVMKSYCCATGDVPGSIYQEFWELRVNPSSCLAFRVDVFSWNENYFDESDWQEKFYIGTWIFCNVTE